MNALSIITNKRDRKIWLRSIRIWQRRPYELAPLSEATHECASCGTVYQGNFCPRCGQSSKIGRFSFKKAILLFLDVWGIGNRGMFRSIRDLMLRPGFMIRDYLRGMQSAYFPPFKMFFLLAALSFVVEHGISLSPQENEKPQEEEKIAEVEEAMKKDGFDTSSFEIRVGKAALKLGKFINNLRKQNSSLFSLVCLLLFAAPLYIFFRHSPMIPDFRFSEFVVALVYTSNMYSIYSIIGTVLNSTIIKMIAVIMIFVALKQLSGYSKRRLLAYIFLTILMSLVVSLVLISLVVLALTYIEGTPTA